MKYLLLTLFFLVPAMEHRISSDDDEDNWSLYSDKSNTKTASDADDIECWNNGDGNDYYFTPFKPFVLDRLSSEQIRKLEDMLKEKLGYKQR